MITTLPSVNDHYVLGSELGTKVTERQGLEGIALSGKSQPHNLSRIPRITIEPMQEIGRESSEVGGPWKNECICVSLFPSLRVGMGGQAFSTPLVQGLVEQKSRHRSGSEVLSDFG